MNGHLCTPVERMDVLLAEHYGQRAQRYRAAAQGYVDDKLREVFPAARGSNIRSAADLIGRHLEGLLTRVTHWSGLDENEVRTILAKLEDRAETLGLHYRLHDHNVKLMDVTALATSLAVNFSYTGQLTG